MSEVRAYSFTEDSAKVEFTLAEKGTARIIFGDEANNLDREAKAEIRAFDYHLSLIHI